MAGYHEDLARQLARRDAALKSATSAFEDAGAGVKNGVGRIGEGLNVNKVIADHPWIAAGVALGAGLIVTRLLSSPSAAAAPAPHIVVEVRNNGGEVTTKEVTPPRRSPIDFIMQAVAGFEAVQGMLKHFQETRRIRPEAAADPVPPETVAEQPAAGQAQV